MTRESITGVPSTEPSGVMVTGLVHQVQRIALPVSRKQDSDLVYYPLHMHILYISYHL